MADKYKRADRPYTYVAAQMGNAMEPLPYWFQLLVPLGLLRFDGEGNVEVPTITGAWALVMPGDWVVLQQKPKQLGWLSAEYIIWHVEHEDFERTWVKV